MTTNFTLNQLTRLLYQETSPAESSMLVELMDLCPELNEKFEELKDGKEMLSQFSAGPSAQSMDKILRYSRLQTV